VGNPDTLLSIMRTFDHGQCCNNLPAPVIRDVKSMSQTFADIAAYDELVQASIGGGTEPQRIWGQATSPNFFDVTRMTMAARRGFAGNEEKATVIVLGYRLWQKMLQGDPQISGRQIQVSSHVYTVVGVAPKGFRGLDQILYPQFWVPLGNLGEFTANSPSQDSRTTQWLRVPGGSNPRRRFIACGLQGADDGGAYSQCTVPSRLMGTLFTVFGVAGVLLASIGLYGVMSYSVNQRTREIGIRMARGAKASQVQAMVVRGGLRLVLMATVLGIPLAFASARLTGSLLYGVKPWDVETFTAVPVFLTAISLLACWIPSRRVSLVNPMEMLRSE